MIGFANLLFRKNISEAKMTVNLPQQADLTMKLKQKVAAIVC